MKSFDRLDSIIREGRWLDLFKINPRHVCNVLSFKDALRLSNLLFQNHFDFDEDGREFTRRLLYAVKEASPETWKQAWGFEVLLGEVCVTAYRSSEQYFAIRRAVRRTKPVPPFLKMTLANCGGEYGVPCVSFQQAETLFNEVLQESPCLNVLYGLRSLYKGIEGRKDKVDEYNQLIKEKELQWPLAPPYWVPYTSHPLEFDRPSSSLVVNIVRASRDQVMVWIQKSDWTFFHQVDPRGVVNVISFEDSLRLVHRLLLDSEKSAEYAVEIISALRVERLDLCLDDWQFHAFLGYACEQVGRWDEMLGGYWEAKIRFVDKPIPGNLSIALARCAFAPDEPSISFEEAKRYLQDALKEEMYVDALELLERIYSVTGDIEKAKKTQDLIASLGEKGIRSPTLLPLCVYENFDLLI